MKRFFYILLLLFVGIIILIMNVSCQDLLAISGEDNIGGFKEISTNPNNGTITINVLTVMANACGNFERLEYSIDGNTVIVHFYSSNSGDICAQVITEEEHNLVITDLSSGTYTIQTNDGYYQDYSYSQSGWSETLTITLN